jgi:predicted RNase H-like nuclease (RuvC/YqgF family)
VANAKKPESFITSVENDYTHHQFDDILNDGVQQENHKLRQQLGSLQEKFESKKLVHNGVLEQLKEVQNHNLTLEKAKKTAYELVDQLKKTSRRKKKMTTGLQMDIDEFGAEQSYPGASVHQTDTFSAPFVDSETGTAELGMVLFPGPKQDEGAPQQSSGTYP